MSMRYLPQASLTTLCFLLATSCFAHEGRRFLVQVENNQLIAQGVNTENPIRFNEAAVRPYINVIHDHWTNYGFNGVDTAVASLPGFDVPASEMRLWGKKLVLTVNNVYRWDKAPEAPTPSSQVVLTSALEEDFSLKFNRDAVGTVTGLPGSLQLAAHVPKTGLIDLDLRYELKKHVVDSIYVIDLKLSVVSENVTDSDTVYVILGPPGYKYQKALMFLEKYLSVNSPEVATDKILGSWSLTKNTEDYVVLIILAMIFLIIIMIALQRYFKSNRLSK